MAMEIADERIPAGESRWLSLEVTRDADRSPIALELHVVNGHEDGSVLWLQGGVHGNEPVGGLAARDFALGVDPSDLSGTLVALPVANPSAFANKQRGSQVVHVGVADVNSLFPGSPGGPFPEQLAHTLFSLVTAHADVVIDAHSADEETVMHTGFVYAPATADETRRRTRALASATGMAHVLELDPSEISGFLVAELAREGIPSLMVETGGGATVFDWAYERYVTCFRRIAGHLEMLPRAGDPGGEPAFHDDLSFVYATRGGYVEMAVRGGDTVAKGEFLGEITDLRGETVEALEAPFEATVLAIRSFPTARPGDMMVELAR